MTTSGIDQVSVLNVSVSAMDLADCVDTIESWVDTRQRSYICVTGVHGIIESQYDKGLRAIHNSAGMVAPDGMPVVWMARRLGFKQTDRVYGPDLMRLVFKRERSRRFRHYCYGSSQQTLEQLTTALSETYPGANVVGTLSPPFGDLSPQEDESFTRAINAAEPDIVWVGLSTPKQERWMASHRDKLEAPVLIGVGAAFDFIAGRKVQAPRWMQQRGLEWAFRLATEPRRLWRRYLSIVPQFLVLAGFALLRHYLWPRRTARWGAAS